MEDEWNFNWSLFGNHTMKPSWSRNEVKFTCLDYMSERWIQRTEKSVLVMHLLLFKHKMQQLLLCHLEILHKCHYFLFWYLVCTCDQESETARSNQDWCTSALKKLKEASPLSLKVTLRSVSKLSTLVVASLLWYVCWCC